MNHRAMTSLVLGIMSIFIPFIGVLLSIAGIWYADRGIKEIKQTGEEGITYAKAGKIFSAIGLSVQVALIILILLGSWLFSLF